MDSAANMESVPGRRSRLPAAALVLVILLFNANNIAWIGADGSVPMWDEISHFKRSAKFGFMLFRSNDVTRMGGVELEALDRLKQASPAGSYMLRSPASGYAAALGGLYGGPKHPPFAYMVSAPVAWLTRSPDAAAGFSAFLFSAVLLASVFSIASRFSNPWGGVLAAFMVATMPQVLSLSSRFLLDVPLAAMCALTYAVYLSSEGFGKRRESVLFGVVFGVGMLTKEIFPVFTAGIFAVEASRGILGRLSGTRSPALRNAGIAAAAALTTAGFWFIYYLPGLFKVFTKHQFMGSVEMDPGWREGAGALFYVVGLSVQATFAYACVFVPCAFLFVRANFRKGAFIPILLWIAAPLAFFTFISNKDFRYTLSCLPAVAAVTGAVLASLRPRALAVAACLAVAAAGLVQSMHYCWGAPDLPDAEIELFPGVKSDVSRINLIPPAVPPAAARSSSAVDGIMRILDAESAKAAAAGRNRLVVKYLFDIPEISTPVELRYLKSNYRAYFTCEGVEIQARTALFNPQEMDDADLVIVKLKGTLGPPHMTDFALKAMEHFRGRIRQFATLSAFRHSDGTPVAIYRSLKHEAGGKRSEGGDSDG